MSDSRQLPLTGVQVLDLTRLLPGPWASMLLADYGADVIKVEQPGRGDYSRWATPNYEQESVYFCSVNRGKRSLALDLATPEGQRVLLQLVEQTDILLESFRPGVADRLGVGYATMSAVNPRLIYCSITGFGQTGPYSGYAGHDLNIAGLAGFLNVTEEPPRVAGLQMADFAAASMSVIGLLLALRHRERTGQGQHLDVAMLDSLVSWTSITATSAFARLAGFSGEPPLQAFGGNPRYNVYRAGDGRYLSVSLLERVFWVKLCRAVGREDLINETETDRDRLTDHGELREPYEQFLTDLFAQHSRDEWVTRLQAHDVPCCPVYTPDEVFEDEHIRQRGMVEWLDHPHEGRIPQLGFPIKSTAMQPRIGSPPPSRGEHGASILRDLGYDPEEIARLCDAGVI